MLHQGQATSKPGDQIFQLLLEQGKWGVDCKGLREDHKVGAIRSHISADTPQAPLQTIAHDGIPQLPPHREDHPGTILPATNPQALPFDPLHGERVVLRRGSAQTARRLRPRRRRRLIMARPEEAPMRLRKPCLLCRFLLLG